MGSVPSVSSCEPYIHPIVFIFPFSRSHAMNGLRTGYAVALRVGGG